MASGIDKFDKAVTEQADPFAHKDEQYTRALASEPGLAYSEFFARLTADVIRNGAAHNSLGKNLSSAEFEDIRDAARPQAMKVIRLGEVTPDMTVVDYGCGSLRLGIHLIDLLEPGKFIGIDVISDFYDMGVEMIGQDYLDKKQVTLDVISDESVAAAAVRRPDYVFSHAVMGHIPPQEIDYVVGNLLKLTKRPGAKLFFNAAVADKEVRFRSISWARTKEDILNRFGALELLQYQQGRDIKSPATGDLVGNATFVFQRPA